MTQGFTKHCCLGFIGLVKLIGFVPLWLKKDFSEWTQCLSN
jgi:hypothetical protein